MIDLANDYDLYWPRYPENMIESLVKDMKGKNPRKIVDIGSGTGIALGLLVQALGPKHEYHAIDISSNMIEKGREKLPHVKWHLGRTEEILPLLPDMDLFMMDLVMAAQSFQRMDRPQLLR